MNNKVLITEAREFVLNSDDCEYGELLMWMADALEKLEGENQNMREVLKDTCEHCGCNCDPCQNPECLFYKFGLWQQPPTDEVK